MANNFDAARLALRSLYPRNDLLLDDKGLPSVMVYIPKFRLCDVLSTGDESVHPAFIVGGKEIDGFYMGKYQSCRYNGRMYSLGRKDVNTGIYMDKFINESRAKGKGWHQVTAAEWAAVALWSHRHGITPKGNNNYGKDKTENIYSADTMARDGKTGNILYVKTGTGPVTWTHNGQADGIWDMAGNGYEWNIGTAVLNGELLIIQNNDAADSGCDLADTSAAWKAIRASDGALITPDGMGTTSGSVKLNNNGGRWQYSDEVMNSQSYGVGCSFAKVTVDSCIGGKTKLLLQALALMPDTALVGDNVDAGYGKEEFLAYNAESKMLHQVHGSFFFTNDSKGQLSARFTPNAARDEIGPNIGGRLAYIDLPE